MDSKDKLWLLSTLLVLMTSLVIGRAVDLLSLPDVLAGVGVSLVILFGFGATLRGIVENRIDRVLQHYSDRFATALASPNRNSWLYDHATVVQIEERLKCKHIWIISPDLSYDTGEDVALGRAIMANAKRGITYTYFVPLSEHISARMPALRALFSKNLDKLKVVGYNQEDFRQIVLSHIVVYNPELEFGQSSQVLIELPIEEKGNWIEVSSEAAVVLTGRFRKLLAIGQIIA